MPIRPRGLRRVIALAAVPLAISAAAGMVLASSYSVFSASTSSPSNAWTTGTVVLKNDSTVFGARSLTGSAVYSASNLKPGGPEDIKCVTVEYTGSTDVAVRLRAGSVSDPDGLLPYLNIQIQLGSGATDRTCTSYSDNGFTCFPPRPSTSVYPAATLSTISGT